MRSLMTIFVLALAATTAIASSGPSNYSFGYSSDDAEPTPYLGVDTRDITPDRMNALNLKDEQGVEVTMVDQDAPAGKAGLKEQDVILSVNGTPIESVEQLRRVIREIPVGRVISMNIIRKGQPLTLKAQLADREREFAYSYAPKAYKFSMPAVPAVPAIPAIPAMPAMPEMDYPVSIVVVHSWMRSGLMIENITPQLGEYFGAKGGEGVLVRSVEKGSRAEKAGLRAGDVIIKANGETVRDAGDFSRALRSRKDDTSSITIIRDKKQQTLTLTLPPRQTGQILNESFELPEINVDTQAALTEARAEMEHSHLQIEEAMRVQASQIQKDVQRELTEFKRKGIDSGRLRNQMRDMSRQLRDLEIKIRADI